LNTHEPSSLFLPFTPLFLPPYLLSLEAVAHIQRDFGLVFSIRLELVREDAGVGRDGGNVDGGDALRDVNVGRDRVRGHKLKGGHTGVRSEKESWKEGEGKSKGVGWGRREYKRSVKCSTARVT